MKPIDVQAVNVIVVRANVSPTDRRNPLADEARQSR